MHELVGGTRAHDCLAHLGLSFRWQISSVPCVACAPRLPAASNGAHAGAARTQLQLYQQRVALACLRTPPGRMLLAQLSSTSSAQAWVAFFLPVGSLKFLGGHGVKRLWRNANVSAAF